MEAYGFGIYLGVKKSDAPCLILVIIKWAIFIGPHIRGGEATGK